MFVIVSQKEKRDLTSGFAVAGVPAVPVLCGGVFFSG